MSNGEDEDLAGVIGGAAIFLGALWLLGKLIKNDPITRCPNCHLVVKNNLPQCPRCGVKTHKGGLLQGVFAFLLVL